MRTITKSIVFALLLLCCSVVANAQTELQSSSQVSADDALSGKKLQMYIGTGQGAVPDAAYNVYYESGFKARLCSLGDHFSLFGTLSTGIVYSHFYDCGSEGVAFFFEEERRERLMLSMVGGVEYHTPLGKKCAFFCDLGLGPSTLHILSDNWIDLSLHVGAGVVFRNGLSAGLQLRYLPTYVCTNYSSASPIFYRQLLMWSLQVGWYIF